MATVRSTRRLRARLFLACFLSFGVVVLLAILALAALLVWRNAQRHGGVKTPESVAALQRITRYGAAGGAAEADPVKRGEYLAKAGDCIACHTAQGGQPFAGGLELKTPFGVIVASNITPDKRYGIGAWRDADFLRAVKEGVGPHGKRLYPAMPYNLYARVTDKDVLDILAYLRTVPAVHQPVAENRLPFPFNIRQMMFGWNLLFFNPTPFVPDPKQSVEWNRGKYLVDGLGHCTACHSGKNFLGGDTDYLLGYDLEGWHAPEITGNDYTGIGAWSVDDVKAYLHGGGNRIGVAAGSMAEVVTNSTQHFTDADLKAVAVYLKSIPGSGTRRPMPLGEQGTQMMLGRDVYLNNCAACHKSDGHGVEAMVPSLADNPSIQAAGAQDAIRTILMGGRGAPTASNPTSAQMPAFAWKLSDEEVGAVTTYIRNTWGNAAPAVKARDVETIRTTLGADQTPRTSP